MEELRQMTRKNLLTLALAGTLGMTALFAPVSSAQAAPSTVGGYDSLISELQAEQEKASEKLENLKVDIAENEAEATQLVAEIQETQATLETLQEEIEALKVVIERREEQLNEQARGLQVMGETNNLIHFVLKAESLNDVVGRVDVVSTIISSNKQQVALQEADKAKVEEKEAETVAKQEEQQLLASKLESKKAELEEKQAEQESLVASIAAEKAVAQAERNELVERAKAAEARRQELAAVRVASSQTTATSSTQSASSSSNSSSDSAKATQAVTPSTSKPAEAPAPAPAPAANNGSLLGIAHSLSGIRYQYGGTTLSGFDCSGFTSYVFRQAGRSIPRTAAGQYSATSRVSRAQAQPGDLVFFNQGGGIDHVGIYLGGGSFIGAQSSTGVAVASLNSGYWANYVVGFGR